MFEIHANQKGKPPANAGQRARGPLDETPNGQRRIVSPRPQRVCRPGNRGLFRYQFDSSQARQTVRWRRFLGLEFAPVFVVKPGAADRKARFCIRNQAAWQVLPPGFSVSYQRIFPACRENPFLFCRIFCRNGIFNGSGENKNTLRRMAWFPDSFSGFMGAARAFSGAFVHLPK